MMMMMIVVVVCDEHTTPPRTCTAMFAPAPTPLTEIPVVFTLYVSAVCVRSVHCHKSIIIYIINNRLNSLSGGTAAACERASTQASTATMKIMVL